MSVFETCSASYDLQNQTAEFIRCIADTKENVSTTATATATATAQRSAATTEGVTHEFNVSLFRQYNRSTQRA